MYDFYALLEKFNELNHKIEVLERIKVKKVTSNLFNMELYTKNLEKIFEKAFSEKILGEQKAHIL